MIEGHIHTPHIGPRLETIDRQQRVVRASEEQAGKTLILESYGLTIFLQHYVAKLK